VRRKLTDRAERFVKSKQRHGGKSMRKSEKKRGAAQAQRAIRLWRMARY
jgi:hypothetical protein